MDIIDCIVRKKVGHLCNIINTLEKSLQRFTYEGLGRCIDALIKCDETISSPSLLLLTESNYNKYLECVQGEVFSLVQLNCYVRAQCANALKGIVSGDNRRDSVISAVYGLLFDQQAKVKVDKYIYYTKVLSSYFGEKKIDIWYRLTNYLDYHAYDENYVAVKLKCSRYVLKINGTPIEQFIGTDVFYHFNHATRHEIINLYIYCDMLLLHEYDVETVRKLMLLDIYYFRSGDSKFYMYLFPQDVDPVRGHIISAWRT